MSPVFEIEYCHFIQKSTHQSTDSRPFVDYTPILYTQHNQLNLKSPPLTTHTTHHALLSFLLPLLHVILLIPFINPSRLQRLPPPLRQRRQRPRPLFLLPSRQCLTFTTSHLRLISPRRRQRHQESLPSLLSRQRSASVRQRRQRSRLR